MGTILVKSALNALKIEVFKQTKIFIEEYHFRGMFFLIKALYLLKSCQFFVS